MEWVFIGTTKISGVVCLVELVEEKNRILKASSLENCLLKTYVDLPFAADFHSSYHLVIVVREVLAQHFLVQYVSDINKQFENSKWNPSGYYNA